MQGSLWRRCLAQLEVELPEQQFNTWIRPLQAVEDGRTLRLLAPNRFVVEWVTANLLPRVGENAETVLNYMHPIREKHGFPAPCPLILAKNL